MLPNSDPPTPFNPSEDNDRSLAWFPDGFTFDSPLLEVMPFPNGVSSQLAELQQLVAVAKDVQQPLDVRSEAFQSIQHNAKYCRMGQADILRLRRSLITKMMGREDSAQLTYAYIQVQLEECECSVITATSLTNHPCPPFVEGRKRSSGLDLPKVARKACEILLCAFLGKDLAQLKRLGPKECAACIFIVALYLQHGLQEKSKDATTVENLLTRSALQSLWRTLLKAIPKSFKKEAEDFSALYGEQAYRVVMHRIPVQASDSKASTEAPYDLDGTVNLVAHARRAPEGYYVVVPGDIPPASESEAKEIIKRLSNLQSPLPVSRLPTPEKLDAIQGKLFNEFPWAERAIDAIIEELMTRKRFGSIELSFTPILLLGPSGVGKTRLGRRLAEELGMPFMSVGLAAMEDSRSLLGTARGWATAQPAPLVEFLSARKSASAVMLLDEIDKVTPRSTNSTPPTAALLSLLEQENARNFFDGFLQTPVDLSKVCFVATANTVDEVPGPLLSRMRTCVVGRPTASQMASSIGSIAEDVAKDWSLNPQVFPKVAMTELPEVPRNMRHFKALLKDYLARWAVTHLHPSRLH